MSTVIAGVKYNSLIFATSIPQVVNISDGSQFTSGFVAVNPNSKIPAAVDRNGPNGESVNLFESGAIVLYLAEKHQRFMPTDANLRAEVMNWLFWQVEIDAVIIILIPLKSIAINLIQSLSPHLTDGRTGAYDRQLWSLLRLRSCQQD